MTSAELLAWWDGFKATSGGADPRRRLDRIAEMVERLDEVPTPYPVFLETYWPFPAKDGSWRSRWAALWGSVWNPAFRAAAADARRFRNAQEAFRALGHHDGLALSRSVTIQEVPEERKL